MSADTAAAARGGLPRRRAVSFIVLLGCVSLFADMTYEGARSVAGPYLGAFGVSAVTVGFVAGLGELIGYGVRFAAGVVADRSGRYWAITIGGYLVNLFSVPLLALAGIWEVAAVLIVGERMGRAIRSPPRDAMLAQAAGHTGLGWGFGLHQALDQTGAIVGPLAVSLILFAGEGYRTAFAWLVVPALISMSLVVAARLSFPRPHDFDLAPPPLSTEGLPRLYWVYVGAAALIALGYSDFALIAYHFGKAAVMPTGWIPILYAVAMGVDGATGLALGALYDHIGVRTMIMATVIAVLAVPLVFLGGFAPAVVGMVCWGIGTGAQDSVLRAAIAGLAPPQRRATAFGLFNALYGVAWFLGSVLLGVLYDVSIPSLVGVAMGLQAASLPVFFRIARASGPAQ
ncbi:MAG TPA: MFS transporter [Stellaceae bacterium]|nr:MFS transporter [Stellaceae bacterium]